VSLWDKAILSGFAVATFFSVFLSLALPRDGQVVVFGPPFSQAAEVTEIIASAGGKLVGGTGLSWAVIARFDTDGYQAELYRRGALFVGDARFALSCLGSSIIEASPG